MKKLILFLLLTVAGYGQTYQNPTYGTITTKTAPTSTTPPTMATVESVGTIGKIAPANIPITQIPLNYSVLTPTIGGHLQGIDTKLGTIVATTAGVTTRVWFTADVSVVSATNYYATGISKGTLASAIQNVVNNDNEKKYFAQDLIGAPFATATMFPPGVYAGNLSASTTPNSAQQRWTVELYKCNNAGTPIASGVTGAPTGSLGVTVITILDSGLLTLVDGSVTNVQVAGNLGGTGLSIAVGERIRYHVSAEKVGTAAANITQSVYYGTSYNSFIDVPVPLNTTAVQNLSGVSGATTTDALNTLNAAIPVNYSKIVYVNNVNPNSATIFDLNNPPTVNDNALKTDVANLYVGTDASGWVYNSTSLNYVTKSTPATSSIFYNSGTTIPANNTTAPIYRNGALGIGASPTISKVEVLGAQNSRLVHAYSNLTPTIGVTMLQGVSLAQVNLENISYPSYAITGYNVNTTSSFGVLSQVAQSADTGTAPLNIIQANRLDDSGSTGALVVNRPILAINNFGTRLLTILPNGNIGVNSVPTTVSTDKFQVSGNIVASPAVNSNQVVVYSQLEPKITITTSTSITTATTDSGGIGQNGKHVVISNGVNAINITCNGGVTTSYGKVGTGAITFVQGSGRTLVQLSGTAVFNGIAGSTATLWSNGTTDYLAITNY